MGPARAPLGVSINRTTLKNILLNLVINARDAMPSDGQLTLRVLPDKPWTDPATNSIQVGHLIELIDNGAGIPSELHAHLFTPGFTTKGHRGGHGIGLSSIRQMITQQGGNLQLGPGAGGGTRAQLWLPKTEKIDFRTRLSSASRGLPVKQRTALVVEADEQIREFLTLTLTSLNFKVFSAADGQAGLDLFVKQSVYLDLILSELVLPVLSGHRFLQQLYQTNPHQAVLILSAFTETEPHRRFLSDKPWVTLTKPFSLAQLKTAIQQSILSAIPINKRMSGAQKPVVQS
jgi:two-component system cell cycle sensor histidine kinase/response regulator CckA